MKNVIGLFGTCDNNRWRDLFMAKYTELGISFFNPMVENWDPSLAAVEVDHLANDRIIFMPVLGWSYGVATLAEVGFCCVNAALNPDRHYILFIETEMDARLDDPARCKDSKRARELVLKHLSSFTLPNVHVVNSLQEALDLTIKLYK